VYRWSTDEVEPHNRFDYWREVRAKGLFGVTAELARERRADFRGELTLRRIAGAGLVELRASPYKVERGRADIANAPGDSICIYQQLGDGGWFEGMPGGDFAIANGRFATSHTDLPYRTTPLGANGFHLRILKIPVSAVAAPTEPVRSLAPRTFANDALMPLVQSCFTDLIAAGDADEPTRTAPLVQALTQLALIERGLIKPASRRAQSALRIGRLSLARHLIARHLYDPSLSPGMIADLLGVSIRHMHMLFEMAEKSFSQTVTEERLRASSRLLMEAPERMIADIAFACGFESLATFYRVFNAAYGMAPGDFRSRAAAPH
jgi:AraC-like DNA-binding protein